MRQGLNYLRVSSRRQVDKGFDEDGLSLPAQREACARYANEHAIAIVGEYIERGESGVELTVMADLVYLEPKTAGIGYAIALAGIPVYWLRALTTRTGRPEAEPLGVGD